VSEPIEPTRRPAVEPPVDEVEVLRRWERSGALWRVLSRGPTHVTVGLLSCDGGEQMGQLSSSSSDLLEFIGDRESSEP
jgi:hypothetical protein